MSFVGTYFGRNVAIRDADEPAKVVAAQLSLAVPGGTATQGDVLTTSACVTKSIVLTATVNSTQLLVSKVIVNTTMTGSVQGASAATDFEDQELELSYAPESASINLPLIADGAITPSADTSFTLSGPSGYKFGSSSLKLNKDAKILVSDSVEGTTHTITLHVLQEAFAPATDNKGGSARFMSSGVELANQLQFRAADELYASLNAGSSFYSYSENPQIKNIVNFSTDAGFVIPTADGGTKVVRIWDLVQLIEPEEGDTLEERLHAVEVATRDSNSSEYAADANLKAIRERHWLP